MKKLLEEMNERLKFLESQPKTEETLSRIHEITLAIVRVQQILLARPQQASVSAEEWLKANCNDKDWNRMEECLKDSLLTNNVIKYMEEYRNQPKEVAVSAEELFEQQNPQDGKCPEWAVKLANTYANQYNQPAQFVPPLPPKEEAERFKMPSDKQIIDIAVLFNDGKLQKEKLTDMIACAQFILDRLYENGSVEKPSSKENPHEEVLTFLKGM